MYTSSSLDLLYAYPTPKLIKRAKLSNISKFLHGNCKITAKEIQDKSACSIGQSLDYYGFEIRLVIDSLRFHKKQIESYDAQIKVVMDEVGKTL